MADAFVAVADDGSAVYWNPAGLVSGPFLNVQVDFGWEDTGNDEAFDPGAGAEGSASLIAFAVPPLGLSYYRLRSVAVGAPRAEETGQLDREMEVRGLQTLTTHHVGVTVLQSIGEWLTVGATAKAVVGVAGVGTGLGPRRDLGDWIDEAEDLAITSDVRADVDVGAMVDAGRVRVGLTGRNLTEPEFGDGRTGVARARLRREARLGAAWGSSWPSGLSRVTLAADADLTRRVEGVEERRDVAAGVETWWRGQRLGVRGGARASTLGAARPVVTAGVSVAPRVGTFVDGYAAFGDEDARGWGLGVRWVF